MMADNQFIHDNDDDDIFVYTGGRAPRDVRRARIDESIDTIPAFAFNGCQLLIEVEGHDKLKKIEKWAFMRCRSLRPVMKMNGVVEIEDHAFFSCHALTDLDFDKLEIIGIQTFAFCKSLRSISLPSVRRVGVLAFEGCTALTDAVFGKDLERIERLAFRKCTALRRIAIPLKNDLITEDSEFSGSDDAFDRCDSLSRVDIVGGTHETISSLHMEAWRDEMKEAVDRINQTLPGLGGRAGARNRWIESVLHRIDHYKEEHRMVVEEAMTILELALWKAKVLNREGKCNFGEEGKKAKKVKIATDVRQIKPILSLSKRLCTRKADRVTCGASVVIKNVLPFLALK